MAEAKRTPFRSLLLVGDFGEDDPVRDRCQKAAIKEDCLCSAVDCQEFAKSNGEDSLVMISRASLQQGLLDDLVSVPADKVLYLPPGRVLGASKVIQYCRDNGVCDAISMDVTTQDERARKLDAFQGRLALLLKGEDRHYSRMIHKTAVASGDKCFIARPFNTPHRHTFDEGVRAAMKGLGIEILDPADEYWLGWKMTDKMRVMIDKCKIVIADIRKTDGAHNPNVFYELGFGQALGKIVMPFRHPDERDLPPFDIRDEDFLLYEDAIDLALQLYWGLKAKVSESTSAGQHS